MFYTCLQSRACKLKVSTTHAILSTVLTSNIISNHNASIVLDLVIESRRRLPNVVFTKCDCIKKSFKNILCDKNKIIIESRPTVQG